MEQRVLLRGAVLLRGRELEDVHALQAPSVRSRDGFQLILRFGQRDEEDFFAVLEALEQELERERRLAGAGIALDEVEAVRRQPAAEDVIEAGDAGAEALTGRHGVPGLRFGAFTHGQFPPPERASPSRLSRQANA